MVLDSGSHFLPERQVSCARGTSPGLAQITASPYHCSNTPHGSPLPNVPQHNIRGPPHPTNLLFLPAFMTQSLSSHTRTLPGPLPHAGRPYPPPRPPCPSSPPPHVGPQVLLLWPPYFKACLSAHLICLVPRRCCLLCLQTGWCALCTDVCGIGVELIFIKYRCSGSCVAQSCLRPHASFGCQEAAIHTQPGARGQAHGC